MTDMLIFFAWLFAVLGATGLLAFILAILCSLLLAAVKEEENS